MPVERSTKTFFVKIEKKGFKIIFKLSHQFIKIYV